MDKVTLITLGVRNIVNSRDFYKGLGFITNNNEENPAIVLFETKSTQLALYPIEGLANDVNEENPPKVISGFSGIALAYNTDSKEAVDELYIKVRGLGGTIECEPQDVFWGGYHFYFSDLDGHYWEIAYAFPKE